MNRTVNRLITALDNHVIQNSVAWNIYFSYSTGVDPKDRQKLLELDTNVILSPIAIKVRDFVREYRTWE